MLKSIEVRSMRLRLGGYKGAGRQKSLRDINIMKYKDMYKLTKKYFQVRRARAHKAKASKKIVPKPKWH